MKIKLAIQKLEAHNKWRRGGDMIMIDVLKLGIAIDTIVAYHLELEKNEFIGKYLDKKMKDHNLPLSIQYYDLLGRHTEDAEKKWKIKLKKENK